MQLSTDHNEAPTHSLLSLHEPVNVKIEKAVIEAACVENRKPEAPTIDHLRPENVNQYDRPSIKATTFQTDVLDSSTKKTTVTRIAPRPDNLPHECNKPTGIVPVKRKPVDDIELLEDQTTSTEDSPTSLEDIGTNLTITTLQNLPPLPSSFLPGIDDDMAGLLLPTPTTITATEQDTPMTVTSNKTLSSTSSSSASSSSSSSSGTTDSSILTIDNISDFQLSSLPNLAAFNFTPDQLPSPSSPGQQTPLFELGDSSNIDLSDPSKSELLQNMISNYGTYEEFALAHPYLAAELLRREITNQKVRADNRERKKRWREQNEERNKDNDLRCRVNKRANKLFGKEDSEPKQRWAKDEFMKRQFRRKDKERRRNVVDDVVSSASPVSFPGMNEPALTGHLPLLQDAYVSMLFNNLGSLPPAVALKLVDGIKLMETTIKNSGADHDHALPQQLAEFLQQLQHLQVSSSSSPPVSSSPPPPPPPPPSEPHSPPIAGSHSPHVAHVASPLATSQESQQQQQQQNPIEESPSSSSSSSSSPSQPEKITPPPMSGNLSALLIQTLQQTAPPPPLPVEKIEPTTFTAPSSPATTEYSGASDHSHHSATVRLYPMEAIMTLMKVNAEWARQ